LSQEDDSVTVGELVAIYLILNIFNFDTWVLFKSSDVDLVIEVTNVADNCVVLHFCHVLDQNNVFVTSSSDKDISSVDD